MNNSKKTIAFDVDNVLADTINKFCQKANAKWGTTLTKDKIRSPKIIGSIRAKPKDVFSIQDEVWEDWEEILPIEKDAGETIERLRTQDHMIVIATARPKRSIVSVCEWLKKYNIYFDEFFAFGFNESKSTLNANILVDDTLEEIAAFTHNKGERLGLIYHQPWNRSLPLFSNVRRIKSLKEILHIIRQ